MMSGWESANMVLLYFFVLVMSAPGIAMLARRAVEELNKAKEAEPRKIED